MINYTIHHCGAIRNQVFTGSVEKWKRKGQHPELFQTLATC